MINKNRNQKNKKGFLLILEVTIGILILFSSLMISLEKQKSITMETYNINDQNFMLMDYLRVYTQENLRGEFNDQSTLNSSVNDHLQNLNSDFASETIICISGNSCVSQNIPNNKEISTIEFLVASSDTNRNLKTQKIKIYIWEKY